MIRFIERLPDWLQPAATLVFAVAAALVLHRLFLVILRRAARRIPVLAAAEGVRRVCAPTRWLMVALALSATQPALGLGVQSAAAWRQVAGLVLPALIGWLAIALIGTVFAALEASTDISVADNLMARRRRTRAGILRRIVIFLALLVTFCMMLMSIPAVRSIGLTLIASAGVAGIAVGAAAQPALKNLIAGIQMAFTEPIRLDDVVIIDGEWGRIEEIRLTFVVVKVWDERRLIVPISRFLEDSFQNWTRQTSQLLGTAFLHVDPCADVSRLRAKLSEIVQANANWDGRVAGLQVTELGADQMELRALVSAADAGRAFDLRCDVREAMMAFIRDEMPEAIVRHRGDVTLRAQRDAAPEHHAEQHLPLRAG